MQRFFDIIFSGLAILLLAPILVPIIFVLLFTGEGEVFYVQDRVGKNGSIIRLYKFATMLKDSEKKGTVTIMNDPRILPFGKFLRKTKINEIPQLINVFIGDMSIIGPRPQTKRCFSAFPHESKKRIIEVRPGLSGIGSIVFRNEEMMLNESVNHKNFYDDEIMPFKGLLEEWYVKNNSLKNYFILIFLTIFVVVNSRESMVWRIFKDLPKPPKSLKNFLVQS